MNRFVRISVVSILMSSVLSAVFNIQQSSQSFAEEVSQSADPIIKEVEFEEQYFYFSTDYLESQIDTTVIVPIESKVATPELVIQLPDKAVIQEEALVNTIVKKGSGNEEWILENGSEGTKFELPLTFSESGSYTIQLGEEKLLITITDSEESSEESQDDLQEKQGEVSEVQEDAISEAEMQEVFDSFEEFKEIIPNDVGTRANLVEVTNWTELRNAWNSSSVEGVILMNNITGTGVLQFNTRSTSFTLDGNGYELNLGNNTFPVNRTAVATYDIRNISRLHSTANQVTGIISAGDASALGSNVTATFTNIRSSETMNTRIFSVSGGQLNLAGEIYWMTQSEMAVTGGVDVAPNAQVFSKKQSNADARSFFWFPTTTRTTVGSRNFVVGENASVNFRMTGSHTQYPVVFAYYDEIRLKPGASFNGTMPGNAFRSDYEASNFIAEGNNKINLTALNRGYAPVEFNSVVASGSQRVFSVGPESEIYIIGDTNAPLFDGATAIDAARRVVTIDSPKILDLRNRTSGTGAGATIATTNLREFTIRNSNLSVWRTATPVDSTADYFTPEIDFVTQVAGGTTTSSDPTLASYFPTSRLRRISALNQAPIVELIPTTDADKTLNAKVIIGYVPDENGMDESGNVNYIPMLAGEGEAEVTFTDSFGNTHSASTNNQGIATVSLEAFNVASEEVRASAQRGPWISENEATWNVVDVTPPEPAYVNNQSNVDIATKNLSGTGEVGSTVRFSLNGIFMDDWSTVIDGAGNWQTELPAELLQIGDKIQVFLTDNAGEAIGIPNPPATNNIIGNSNPASEMSYRDAVFKAATEITVTEILELDPVNPVDPLDPGLDIIPENPPTLPEEQGSFSIDFVSKFDFGTQAISVQDETYFAKPQRLLDENGMVVENEERPNYIQVSDRRALNERSGWELSVSQESQFSTDTGKELAGAQLQLANAEVVTASGNQAPNFVQNAQNLVPGTRHRLVIAEGNEGQGTWVYRFGNELNGNESVKLNVPKGANPDADKYSATLNWELSSVPAN